MRFSGSEYYFLVIDEHTSRQLRVRVSERSVKAHILPSKMKEERNYDNGVIWIKYEEERCYSCSSRECPREVWIEIRVYRLAVKFQGGRLVSEISWRIQRYGKTKIEHLLFAKANPSIMTIRFGPWERALHQYNLLLFTLICILRNKF